MRPGIYEAKSYAEKVVDAQGDARVTIECAGIKVKIGILQYRLIIESLLREKIDPCKSEVPLAGEVNEILVGMTLDALHEHKLPLVELLDKNAARVKKEMKEKDQAHG